MGRDGVLRQLAGNAIGRRRHDADDFMQFASAIDPLEAPADRIGPGPRPPRKRVVDDGHSRRAVIVRRANERPFNIVMSIVSKTGCRCCSPIGASRLIRPVEGRATVSGPLHELEGEKRHRRGDRRRPHTWQCASVVEQVG